MEPLTSFHIAGAWVSIFLTLCIFSFLYEDNPLYKLAEHLFLGVSVGIGIVEIYYGAFKPNVIDKLAEGQLLPLIPLALIVLLFLKLSTKLGWLARIPIAFLVAAYAGVKLTGEANANLMTQVAQSMPDLRTLWAEHGLWDWAADGAGVISGIILVTGLAACLLHFYFSAPQSRVLKHVSRFGVLTLMLSFGASFGYTVMGRISLCIGRVQEMIGLDRPAEAAAQIHPQVATLASLVVVVAFLVVWKVRGGQTEPAA
jgi:hypothetical protein